VLRSYQLRNVRVGEPGRAKTALQLLNRLLPQGSSLKIDAPANCIHLLTTPSAHAAAWDFISAIDIAESSPAGVPEQAELGGEIRESLRRLSEGSPQSEKLLQAVDRLQQEMSSLSASSGRQRRQLLVILSIGAVLALGSGFVLVRRRPGRSAQDAPSAAAPSAFSLLAPENIGAALEPMQRRMQQEMLSALNAAAIRMESWYNEQKAQREQLAQLAASQESRIAEVRDRLLADNRELIESASVRFNDSASRIEMGVQNLSAQNDRVGAIAGELATAVRELDSTKDHLFRLQEELAGKSSMLDSARQTLSEREGEIVRQQAKLAALTLILEEGAVLPELRFEPGAAATRPSHLSTPCKQTLPSMPAAPILRRFQFLPPEFKESRS
jgi:cell division protein ZapA (FtsZ GTPase activity inhibitor)